MYELPSEDPQEPGLPDEFHLHQPQLLSETFGPPGLDTLAPSNAALVALAVEGLAAAGARPATPDEARAMLRLGSR
ncbi:MAG: 3-keto-5-aminohexanoate cleavage protein [Candidatus Competibacterales bacterium]